MTELSLTTPKSPAEPGKARRLFRWVNFSLLLPHPRLLALAAAGLRFYQASGLQRLARASGLLRFLPGPLAAWEPLLPTLPSAADRARLPERTPAEEPKRSTLATKSRNRRGFRISKRK